MRLDIRHTTRYRFDAPVRYGLQQLRKTPKSNAGQTVVDWSTEISGGRLEVSYEDHHHNRVDLISFESETTELVVACSGSVEVEERNGIVGTHRGPSPLWLYQRSTPRTEPGAGCADLIASISRGDALDDLHALSKAILGRVAYVTGASDPAWSAEDTLEAGKGVCQDHAHVFVTCARKMGHPARYVSGYLMLNDRVDQDATHAWAEAHVDGIGWVGFDVSNGISPDERYVRVATGLDYSEAAPVTGMRLGGSEETLSVEVQVAQQ